jgi:NADH dehydrogenase FAD-containing subunit
MDTNSRARVLVLGGGYAGMLAAARIARRNVAAVTLIDQRPSFVQRIRLHEVLAGAAVPEVAYGPALARRGVQFVQARVVGLDPARQEVQIAANGATRRLGYDILVLALGSTGAADVPGAATHGLRLDDPTTLAHANTELRRLAGAGGNVLVVGGGLTAIESAAELAEQLPGLRVTLAMGGALGAGFSPAAVQHLRAGLVRLGVTIHEGARVTALERGQAWLASATALAYDQCVWAGGFIAPSLLAEAGLSADGQGRAFVSAALHLPGNPTIFVAGDCAAAGNAGRTIRMGCVSALPMGAHAGENVAALLAGAPLRPFSFGFPGRNVSLGRRDGLVQLTDPHDRPSGRVLTGWAGATVKELICRMTLEAVRGELHSGLPLYRWRSGNGWWAAPAVVA